MLAKNLQLKNWIVFSIFFLLLALPATNVSAVSFRGWFRGAHGYNKAIQTTNENEPLIVYFHTSWCEWCNKMNKMYLSSNKVNQFLDSFAKVEINPDIGKEGELIEKKYGVKGYPSFYVSIPSLGTEAKRVHPFKGDKSLTDDEFINAINKALAKQYADKGAASYDDQKYDEARKYLDMAIEYNPDKAYFYYLKGHIDYETGYTAKDNSLLKKAETNYLKALEVDPNHESTKNDLKQLHKLMKHLGI